MADNTVTEGINRLQHGTSYRFADWPNTDVPNWRAGVYTLWRGSELVYVGMAGAIATGGSA